MGNHVATTEPEAAPTSELLRRHGLRRTTARTAILAVLANTTHLTAAQLHRALNTDNVIIDASTVHRTVDTLANSGLLHVVPTASGMTYGLSKKPHHHAACLQCGDINDLNAAAFNESAIPTPTRGFNPTGGVVVYGTCVTCEREAPTSSS